MTIKAIKHKQKVFGIMYESTARDQLNILYQHDCETFEYYLWREQAALKKKQNSSKMKVRIIIKSEPNL